MKVIAITLLILTLSTKSFSDNSHIQNNVPQKTTTKTSAPIPLGTEISEQEAIKRAEQFVIDNGYTDLPPAEDSTKITAEIYDFLATRQQVIKLRHNSLINKSYGISKHKRGNLPGWSIIFSRTPNNHFNPDNGRAVVMEIDGSKIHMDANDWPLNEIDKKLAN